MSHVRTDQELVLMRKSGTICADALLQVLDAVKPGVTTLALDAIAEKAILSKAGEISFRTVASYPYTICTTVNDEVVHGLPTEYKLQKGDVLSIDIGALYKGWHSDLAQTVIVGYQNLVDAPQKVRDFVQTGKTALTRALEQVKAGNRVGDISHAMQSVVEAQGYSVVRALTGHGVGKELHEEPTIPCFGKPGKGELLQAGMTIAVEVIYNQGKSEVSWKNKDGWTIATADGSLAGLFERTVAVTESGFEILTPID